MLDYYIDLGSSTVKVYKYDGELVLLEEYSIYFKDGFDTLKGLSKSNLKELCDYFNLLIKKYDFKYENTHIYVTGIFRTLSFERKRELVKLFNDKFDLYFNIISHGIENYYLSCAMQHDYNMKKVLIINMGGKTTELVTFDRGKIIDTTNLDIGVGDLLNRFHDVNNSISGNTIEEMDEFVTSKIGDIKLEDDYDCAIFTGGEERFEILTNFNLVDNNLFDDGIHKYMISFDDYLKGTEKVFFDITIDELYDLMPDNPKWMDGARAGAIIPFTLFKRAGVKWIVPSDLNLINGVVKDL